LFLQKTNIIRDYLEDLEQGRTWWPQEVWGLYARTLNEFRNAPDSTTSLACLNHLVTDALEHIPDCLDYLSRLHDVKVFEFCAIPQVMAIATLAEVYNNPNVFRKVVKVRKGLSAKMMLQSSNLSQVGHWFRQFALDIKRKIPHKDPNAKRTLAAVDRCLQLVAPHTAGTINHTPLRIMSVLAWVAFIISVVHLALRYQERHREINLAGPTPFRPNAYDWSAGMGCILSLAYILGFFGIHAIVTDDVPAPKTLDPVSMPLTASQTYLKSQ